MRLKHLTEQKLKKINGLSVMSLDQFVDDEQDKKLDEFAPGGAGIPPRGPKTPGKDPWDGNDGPGDDPYSRPEPEYYSRSIDFFGKFEADHFDKEDFNEKTGVFKGYWDYDGKLKQIAYFKFDDPRQASKNFDDSPGMGWYYEPVDENIDEGTYIDPNKDAYMAKVNEFKKLNSTLEQKMKGMFVPIPASRHLYHGTGPFMVAVNSDRVTALAKIKGVHVPFYISTGEGGKLTVPTGKWYPFFGLSSDSGWFNKGSEEDILDFYGSSTLKNIADWLNTNVGNLLALEKEKGPLFLPVFDKINATKAVNQDLSPPPARPSRKDSWGKPLPNGEEIFNKLNKQFEENVNNTLIKIGSKPYYDNKKDSEAPSAPATPTTPATPAGTAGKDVTGSLVLSYNGKPVTTFNISAPFGREHVKKLGDDSKFWTHDQFKLEKNNKDNTWTLIPNPSVPNKTMIDGRAVTSPTKLKPGMVIAVGNPEKKIEKLPLTVSSEGVTEAGFGLGSKFRKFGDDEMQDYLGRVKDKEKLKTDKYKMPFVHGSNIEIKNEEGKKYDTDKLKAAIMQRPTKLLKQNEKMEHSDGSTSIFFNVGLPALKGLAVNEETGDFVIVDTCPGAGACQTYCYAMKGGYVQWKASSMAQTRVLNFLLNDPEGFKKMMEHELGQAERKYGNKGTKVVVRWHDAGDFFSSEYLDVAYSIAQNFPDIDFYAYTKMGGVANASRPANFKMNFSQGAKRGEEKQINFHKTKHSKVVPRDMFYDLIAREGSTLQKDSKGRMQFRGPGELDEFKDRLADKYKLDKKSIITYDRMMATKDDGNQRWNVIVMPGDGDDSANRNDVLGTYLLFH